MDIKLEKKPSKILAVIVSILLILSFALGTQSVISVYAAETNGPTESNLPMSLSSGNTMLIQVDGQYEIILSTSSGSDGGQGYFYELRSSDSSMATKFYTKGGNGATGQQVSIKLNLTAGDIIGMNTASGETGGANTRITSTGFNNAYGGNGGNGGTGVTVTLNGEFLASAQGGCGGGGGGGYAYYAMGGSNSNGTWRGGTGGAGGITEDGVCMVTKSSGGAGGTKDTAGTNGNKGAGIYADASKLLSCTTLTQDYSGAASATVMLIPEYVPTQEETLKDMRKAQDRIAQALENMNGGSENNSASADIITVVAGQNFSEYIKISNDQTIGGSDSGITVINNNVNDNVVKIVGKIDTAGSYQAFIDNIYYTIKVIEEPTSANVSIILD